MLTVPAHIEETYRSIHSSYKLLFKLPSDEEFTWAVLDLKVKASYFKEAFVPSFEL